LDQSRRRKDGASKPQRLKTLVMRPLLDAGLVRRWDPEWMALRRSMHSALPMAGPRARHRMNGDAATRSLEVCPAHEGDVNRGATHDNHDLRWAARRKL
jgi:hypothetical protein